MLGAIFKGVLGRLIALAVGLAVVFVGVFLFQKAQNKITGPKVGDCVSISGSSFNADLDKLSCADADATFVVTATNGDCDDVEVTYEETVNGGKTQELCLWYNVAKGDCIEVSLAGTSPDKKVECTAATGSSVGKVIKVADDASASCPKNTVEEGAIANTKRNKLLCLAVK